MRKKRFLINVFIGYFEIKMSDLFERGKDYLLRPENWFYSLALNCIRKGKTQITEINKFSVGERDSWFRSLK